MKKSFYEILGLDNEATLEDIKKAYFKLAKEYHPDINDSEEGQKIFGEISMAYEVLANPAKRKEYDLSNGKSAKNLTKKKVPPHSEEDELMLNYRRSKIQKAVLGIGFFTVMGGCVAYFMSFFVGLSFLSPLWQQVLTASSGALLCFFWQLDKHFRIDTFLYNPSSKFIIMRLRTLLFSLALAYLATLLFSWILSWWQIDNRFILMGLVLLVLLVGTTLSSDGNFRQRFQQGKIWEIVFLFVKITLWGVFGALMAGLISLLFYIVLQDQQIIWYSFGIGFALTILMKTVEHADLHLLAGRAQTLFQGFLVFVLMGLFFALGLAVGIFI